MNQDAERYAAEALADAMMDGTLADRLDAIVEGWNRPGGARQVCTSAERSAFVAEAARRLRQKCTVVVVVETVPTAKMLGREPGDGDFTALLGVDTPHEYYPGPVFPAVRVTAATREEAFEARCAALRTAHPGVLFSFRHVAISGGE